MCDEIIQEIRVKLPPIEFILEFLKEFSLERIVSREFYTVIDEIVDESKIHDVFVMVDACRDRLWEQINTGHFSDVKKIDRQLYTWVTLQKIMLQLILATKEAKTVGEIVESCMWDLDNALLLGSPIDDVRYNRLLNDCLDLLAKQSKSTNNEIEITISQSDCLRPSVEYRDCEIPLLKKPSLHEFNTNHFVKSQPAVILDCMDHWPALTKWLQPNYLMDVASNRFVPIEVGQNYTNENWSQEMVKFRDFFHRQFVDENDSTDSVEYLAQHNLFDQIPALKMDILTPEYCCLSDRDEAKMEDEEDDVDIKAWLGPKGTVSPMHHDPKHNLLCQIFGHKRVILAAPYQSVNLYPFDGKMLSNTAQIDAENLDFEKFPLAKNVKFYEITLYRGEMLYIPPKWWHHVRSLSKSFSVSFWWK